MLKPNPTRLFQKFLFKENKLYESVSENETYFDQINMLIDEVREYNHIEVLRMFGMDLRMTIFGVLNGVSRLVEEQPPRTIVYKLWAR